MKKRIFYSATLIESDGSDTGVYGDPCEKGQGQTMSNGWWDPSWSRYEVESCQENVRPDEYDPDAEGISAAEWLAQRLGQRLNAIERHSAENWREDGGGAIYACEADTHPYEGKSVSPAAHPEGFTTEEYAEAWRILGEANCLF
jgi:hypothetical protein